MIHFTQNDLVLIGGQYNTRDCDSPALWDAWQPFAEGMPYTILETTRLGVCVVDTAGADLSAHWPDMVRLHVFGPSGDLWWRRDGHIVYWRFVGAMRPEVPAKFAWDDYWKSHEGLAELVADDEKPLRALLWGQYDSENHRWHEDRVGKATVENRLRYPVDNAQPGSRVEMLALELRHPEGSPVAAVWTYTLQTINSTEIAEESNR